MPKWEKGQSGNLAGRPRRMNFDDFLRQALTTKDGQVAKRLVERLIGEATTGNIYAMKLIAERSAGKPQDPTDISLKNGDELTLAQVRTKLAELLSRPEVKRNLDALVASAEPKAEADVLQ